MLLKIITGIENTWESFGQETLIASIAIAFQQLTYATGECG
jgi:hypothetical protein